MNATCSGSPSAAEAVLVMHGSTTPVIADVTDAHNPRTLCTLSRSWVPQLVTQTTMSWSATQGSPSAPGPSVIVSLNPFTGTSIVAASWQGGGYLDGLHAWNSDRSFMAYVTSDASSVNLHLLSGGGDRVIATFGPVPARGRNPLEDDAYLGFSPDGAYLAYVQTFTSSGAQLQIRRSTDGGIAYSQATGTMATWGSTGSRLYFRQPNGTTIEEWTPTGGVAQAFATRIAWIQPRADAGDDSLAFTVRDASGTPHVWLYGHGGRSGFTLPNVRSSPIWLNTVALFEVEEAPCGSACGPGPTTQPDGKTFTYDVGRQVEQSSLISQVDGTWPRPGQI